MMIALFTIVSITFASSYGGYPSLQTHQATPGAAGAGANPFAPYLAMLDQFLPGLGSNPMQYYMYGDAFDGDVKDVAKKVMKGDVFEAMDKVSDLDMYPYMAMQQMKRAGMGGAAGGSSTGTGSSSKMAPWYWMMADLQKPRVNPVTARLQAVRAATDPAAQAPPSSMPQMPFYPFAMAQNFMDTFLPGLSTNPMAYFFYDNVMDADVEEAMEKAMKGDFSEALDKLDYFDDYMPFMMPYAQNMFGAKKAGSQAGAGAGSRPTSPFMPYMMYDMFDLAKAKPSSVKPKTYIQPVIYPNGEVKYFPVSPVNGRLQKTN